VPDFDVGIHVLTYGFTPEQETRLNQLRENVYSFVEYARAREIPTIWAHPLYNSTGKEMPPPDFFNKMLLIFERFEVLNGQRDTWQNLLVHEWLDRITPDEIDQYAHEFGIDPLQFCVDPYRKSMTGGSDCHMGLFAGMTGAYLHVPDLKQRLITCSRSQLALEAIRKGAIAPYGAYQNMEKMTIAFMHYACQIAMNYKDPGLVRMFLHKGKTSMKLVSLGLSNLFCEVQKHKTTSSFIRIFHDSMMGEKPSKLTKLIVKPAYKPVFDEAVHIANAYKAKPEESVDEYNRSILKISRRLYEILGQRLELKLQKIDTGKLSAYPSIEAFIDKLELPSNVRSYTGKSAKEKKAGVDVSRFLDGLPFPFFGTFFVLAAHFTSAKVMFSNRALLNDFSKRLGRLQHPERTLWLADTFVNKNNVPEYLEGMLDVIRKKNLPVDIVTCSSNVQSDDHLIVLKPVMEFSVPGYRDFTLRAPDFIELHNLFLYGGYDRIVCSTEGLLGFFGLYLKHAYTVKATFFMHTDWLLFARKKLHIEGQNLDRVRRLLRWFYNAFDDVITLDSNKKKQVLSHI